MKRSPCLIAVLVVLATRVALAGDAAACIATEEAFGGRTMLRGDLGASDLPPGGGLAAITARPPGGPA